MAPRLILALLLLTGCARPPPWPAPGEFNATNAFRHVTQLVAFGPRPSGSDALARTAEYLAAELKATGVRVEVQEFQAGTPRGPVTFRNVVGRTRAGGGKWIVLGSHYDTKHLPAIRFVGANDGGSSSGVLLELARVLARQPDLMFVFFDGEEAMEDYTATDGLWGSRYFVETLKAAGQVRQIEAMILLDMVGDANLNITLPGTGTPALLGAVFRAAESLGYRPYFSYSGYEVVDDHIPFLSAGIPAVNLIDFEYGSAPGRNDYWHTAEDTLDKLSLRSLEIVGQTTIQLVKQLR